MWLPTAHWSEEQNWTDRGEATTWRLVAASAVENLAGYGVLADAVQRFAGVARGEPSQFVVHAEPGPE